MMETKLAVLRLFNDFFRYRPPHISYAMPGTDEGYQPTPLLHHARDLPVLIHSMVWYIFSVFCPSVSHNDGLSRLVLYWERLMERRFECRTWDAPLSSMQVSTDLERSANTAEPSGTRRAYRTECAEMVFDSASPDVSRIWR